MRQAIFIANPKWGDFFKEREKYNNAKLGPGEQAILVVSSDVKIKLGKAGIEKKKEKTK